MKKHYLPIHEADLTTGEPLVLNSGKGSLIFNVSSKPSALAPSYASAWRVILAGERPGVMVDSHLIELLNPDPSSSSDFSWVKPGIPSHAPTILK